MERLLRVMNQLAGTGRKNTKEIAKDVGCCERTVYRYMDTLRSAGFPVIKVYGSTFQLIPSTGKVPDPTKLVRFTEEEAALIGRLLHCLDNGNTLKENLLLKMSAIYDVAGIKKIVIHKGMEGIVEALKEAADKRRKVLLRDYASSNSGLRKDYLVEPYEMDINFISVAAYDLECDCNKIFKIARIGSVEILPELWTREKKHKYPELDVFRMSGCYPEKVKLAMTLRARNLLVEEYPLAEEEITEADGRWIYEGTVRKMEGVGRFVMGLLDEVEILEGDALRQYIIQRCRMGMERFTAER